MCPMYKRQQSFNPRPYVRGDVPDRYRFDFPFGFNPRPYVRGDASIYISLSPKWGFQSAPLREGRCFTKVLCDNLLGVSIRAPT